MGVKSPQGNKYFIACCDGGMKLFDFETEQVFIYLVRYNIPRWCNHFLRSTVIFAIAQDLLTLWK